MRVQVLAVVVVCFWACKSEPRRCESCTGTGSVTRSFEAPLAGRVAKCELEATGFLGLGSERVATVTIGNESDKPGTFVAGVTAKYPGNGEERAGTADVRIEPHAEGKATIRFEPKDGLLGVQCAATPPSVVQQKTELCPICGGRGLIP